MVKVFIDGTETEVPSGLTVLQALELNGIQVPKFCYHDKLKIAGNCRMCLVEIAPGPPKPQASCATNVAEGMQIKTTTEMVVNARKGAMEFLLANHPLDCPICDQGGECDLQDQAFIYGKDCSRFQEDKRAVQEKTISPFIKTNMTRCIQCTRCVRFMEEIAGTGELGAFNRGNEMEIATFIENNITSNLSGNIIDLCPVGALTAKPYANSYRAWELKKTNSIDLFDSLGSAISVHSKNGEIVRVLPRINEEINEEWLSDKSRFAIDGMLNQRLDSCYIRNDQGKLTPVNFEEAFDVIKQKFSKINPALEFAAITGDFTDIETIRNLKDLMQKFGSEYIESRQSDFTINIEKPENYLFNSQITGVEEADIILLIGTDLKNEAPVLNARIRKTKSPIYLIGEKVDLTYKYKHLGQEKKLLDEILEEKHELSKLFKEAKKPMIIVGMEAFKGEEGLLVHNKLLEISKKFLEKENWNGFNMLHKTASSVGAFTEGFVYEGGINGILNKVKSGQIKALYVLGAEEIDIQSIKNTFIIYQGSHADKIAQIASVILPASSHTEKTAYYANTEGKIQKTEKAVNPVGIAKDDAKIVTMFGEKFGFEILGKYTNKPHSFKLEATNLQGIFCLNKVNFYLSDYISRNSFAMANAVREFAKK